MRTQKLHECTAKSAAEAVSCSIMMKHIAMPSTAKELACLARAQPSNVLKDGHDWARFMENYRLALAVPMDVRSYVSPFYLEN